VGLAVAATIFSTRLTNELPKLLQQGIPQELATAQAMVSGFSLAYWVLAIVAFVGIGLTFALLRGIRAAEAPVEEHVETQAICAFAPNRAATSALTTAMFGGDEEAKAASS
jgi:hypothetical protein